MIWRYQVGFLTGFREWLVTKLGYGNNLAWSGLVGEIVRTKKPSYDEKAAIERLFVLLEQFSKVRNTSNELAANLRGVRTLAASTRMVPPEQPGWLAPRAEVKLRRRPKKHRSSS